MLVWRLCYKRYNYMSAQQTIYDRILKDLEDDKIQQNVILERLWYYLEPIKDITGSGGSGFTYGNGVPTGGVDGDYYIQTDATSIWYNNSGTWALVLSPTPITLDQSDAQAMLAGIPAFPIDGQVYLITNLAIAGVDHIRTVGMVDYANPGFYKFNNNCEAYVTALGVYVPCTYDLATNKVRLQIRGYKTSLTTDQIKNLYVGGTYIEVVPAFGANTFTDVKHISAYLNIPSAAYNNSVGFFFSYDPDQGNILFDNPNNILGSGGEFFIQFQQQFNSLDNVLINTPLYVFDFATSIPSTTGSGSADIYIDFDVIFN
jgi:hypothetical protein